MAQVGKRPFQIAGGLDQMFVVTTDEICAAIKDVFDDTRTIAKPAGALAVAGLKRYLKEKPGSNKRVCRGNKWFKCKFLTGFDIFRNGLNLGNLGKHYLG
ncbi:MAG: hypothetical protein Ct9H300mP8_10090 [Gammaproteobacteria bacterium]|nr:MAG: hypothetical protein Ct9H300mP8_10090 [Gammaproteobacteria bacterium]